MKRTTIFAAAALVAITWHAPALAQSSSSTQERISNLERRIQYLESRVADQGKVISMKDREISKLSGMAVGWFNAVEVTGTVEVEGVHSKPHGESSSTDFDTSTVDLGIEAQVSEWVSAAAVLSWDGDEDKFALDEAAITAAPPDGPWSLAVGRIYVPFGTFDTNLVSDPLTLDVGETREEAVVVGVSSGGFDWALFGFNGDNDPKGKDNVSNFGLAAGYSMETGGTEFGANISWINDIGESDGLQQDGVARVGGWAASLGARHGDASLIIEQVAAMDEFKAGDLAGSKPSAWTVEAAYDFELAGKAATAAASLQGTRQASAADLPERRVLAGISLEVAENVGLGIEWSRDTAYDDEGKDSAITVLLAAEF